MCSSALSRKLYQVVQSLPGLHTSPQQSEFLLLQVLLYPPEGLETPEAPEPHVYQYHLKDTNITI